MIDEVKFDRDFLTKFFQFWLPPGVSWKDIEDGINYADYRDVFWSIPMAFALLLLRFITER
jgi:hypothetical protein